MAAAEPKPSLIERLFAEHRGGLQAFFRRRIRSKADAADLAQEVYLRMPCATAGPVLLHL